MFDLSAVPLPPKGVLVDIGASTGEFFRLAASIMEPTQALFTRL